MDNRSTLEQEYRKLKCLETPDLWSRIEKQLEERPAPVSPGTPTDDLYPLPASPFAPETLSPKSAPRSPRSRSGLPKILSAYGVYKKAAAAAAVILLAVLAPWNRPDLAPHPDGVEETTAIAAAETTAGCGDGIAYETQGPGSSSDGVSHEGEASGKSGGVFSHEGEVSEENQKGAFSSPPQDSGPAFLITPISYSRLSLTPYTPMTVPAQAKTMSYDAVHFSEDILKDTEFLCQGTVTRARLETDQEGNAVMITYDIALDQVYYSQDYVSGADSITVAAPIVPAQADIYSLQGVEQLAATVETVRRYCNPGLKVDGILLTRYSPRSVLSREVRELMGQLAQRLGTRVYQSAIREAIAVKEAQISRENLFTYAPGSNVAKDYQAFLQEALGISWEG